MAVISLFKAVLGQNRYPARVSVVSSSQNLEAGVGVAVSVGVGVTASVGVGVGPGVDVAAGVGVGLATRVVGVADVEPPPVTTDVANVDIATVELAMRVVAVAMRMLLLLVGPRSKSTTELPLEHTTNILSETFRVGPVSAEYSSDTLESPQSNLFPESWLQFIKK